MYTFLLKESGRLLFILLSLPKIKFIPFQYYFVYLFVGCVFPKCIFWICVWVYFSKFSNVWLFFITCPTNWLNVVPTYEYNYILSFRTFFCLFFLLSIYLCLGHCFSMTTSLKKACCGRNNNISYFGIHTISYLLILSFQYSFTLLIYISLMVSFGLSVPESFSHLYLKISSSSIHIESPTHLKTSSFTNSSSPQSITFAFTPVANL